MLLVDDQPARLLTYEAVLQGVGVQCVRAQSGQEALSQLLKQSFALLLLDVSMPDMDGFQTARAIREHPRFEKTPIIFVTGVHISELDSLRGYEVGAIDYISVPIVPEILRSKVALLVELYRRRKELEQLNQQLQRAQGVGSPVDSARRASALLRLADTSRTITDPADLAHAAATILGETLSVSRCGYGQIDPVAETITVQRDWNAPGVTSLAGTLNFRDHGSYVDDLKRGDTVVCADVRLDARTRESSARLELLKARAFVNMPILEAGKFVALLYLNHESPREWQQDELDFMRDIAERTRTAVERRRHEQAVAEDLAVTSMLRDLGMRELNGSGLRGLFEEILSTAIKITRADGGTLQRFDEATRELYFAATQGLDAGLIEHFSRVDATSGSPCGVALSSGKRSLVTYDVADSADPDGSLRRHREYGLHSGQSTPLVTRSGRALGMMSTHWKRPPTFTERELRYLDLLARQAADLIERAEDQQSLQESAEQLRLADKRKDEFIAMLAHELRNPLVPIRTAIELLTGPDGASAIGKVTPMMVRQVGHMVHLIDDLLDVSRMTAGKIVLRREDLKLSDLINEAVETNSAVLTEAGLTLRVNLKHPELYLHVDGTRFSQIVSNLLHNAIKFTPPGGQIEVSDVLQRSESGEGALTVSVTDTGVGIDPAMLSRIFELFAQAEAAGRSAHTGLGIGLALSRRLAELHGGTLTAQSGGADKGSTFSLRLPVPAKLAAAANTPRERAGALEGVQVLVIDDSHDSADAIGLLIEAAGGEVRVAYDGATGIALAQASSPEAILLDIGMPIMDGYETCRRLRQLLGKRVAIIAISGWGQDEVKQKAKQAGFDAHLTKPVPAIDLEEMVMQVRRQMSA